MKTKIALIGAGGHAKVVIEIIEEMGEGIEMINDKNPALSTLNEYKVTTDMPLQDSSVIICVGSNKIRKRIVAGLTNIFATAIHPKANLSKRCNIDAGSVIMAGVTINSNTVIGKHCIINTNASVDHDCVIGDFVHIAPGSAIAGGVTIGEGTQVGVGSSIIPGISIGKWVTIGAGTVVLDDIPDYAVVVGVPGNIIKFNQE
jgi:sugar O-acyltransferase (sialic acid O-acetyltransferase NeuD family)